MIQLSYIFGVKKIRLRTTTGGSIIFKLFIEHGISNIKITTCQVDLIDSVISVGVPNWASEFVRGALEGLSTFLGFVLR